MSITKTDARSTPLTPESLADFEEALPLPGERPLNLTRVANLQRLITDGDFYGVDWHIGINQENGLRYRLDGQHTSHLLRKLLAIDRTDPGHTDDPVFPDGLIASLTTWVFTSVEEDATDLFNMFNNPMSVRTNTDMLSVFRAHFPELSDFDLALLNRLLAGCTHAFKKIHTPLILDFAGPHMYVPTRRFNGQLLYHEGVRHFVHWAAQFKEARLANFLGKAGIVASMLENWLEDPTDATLWWHLILNESAPDPDDESRELAEALKKLAGGPKKSFSEEYHTRCGRSWRRHRKTLAPATAA
jgi:hypothetical protein